MQGDPDGHAGAFPWVGGKCAELANACRIASDVRFWGAGTFGTNKAVNTMAMYNGSHSRAGGWPDPDLLFSHGAVGPTGMFPTCKGAGTLEYCVGSFCDPVVSHATAQFGLWAVMGAPMMLSFDVATLSEAQLALYGNPEIVAVSQDADEHGRGSYGGRYSCFYGFGGWGRSARRRPYTRDTFAAFGTVLYTTERCVHHRAVGVSRSDLVVGSALPVTCVLPFGLF